jgi:hypothetical protein
VQEGKNNIYKFIIAFHIILKNTLVFCKFNVLLFCITLKFKAILQQPTYEKVNEELFLDNPLHVILNKSKLAYRIYVILIANKALKKCYMG